MSLLVLAALLLYLGHALPSAPGMRPRLVRALGRPGFMIAHSALSLATLALLVHAWRTAGPGPYLWTPWPFAAHLALLLTFLAFLMVALRLATPAGAAEAPRPPVGIYRVTRAPGSLGVLLWALAHLQAGGDARRLVLFLALAAIGLHALVKHELLLRRHDPAGWRGVTSLLPFAAILAGHQRLRPGELPVWAALMGVAAWAAMLHLHLSLFGVDPLARVV